ncbi:hypothetical protein [Sphingobium sp. CFD-1]|uniref:hypothetical protein n=1 Tax=Sphingobium sp. CFD-1 TaxID=2878545 RepID=UPI00214CAEE5|nr:hypothetical protein [Sphingobium sp. CFD-1]
MALLDIFKGATQGTGRVGKAVDYLKSNMSVTDEFRAIAKDDELTDALLPSTYKGVHDSATSYGTSAKLAGEQELDGLHTVLDRVSGMTGINRVTNIVEGTALRNIQQEKAAAYLYDAYRAEMDGLPTPALPNDAGVQQVIKVYQESNYAPNVAKRMQDSGMDSAQGLKTSSSWLPVQHDPHKVFRVIGGDENKFKAVARAYGDQIAEQYPALLKSLTKAGDSVDTVLERIGSQFLNNMKRRMQDSSGGVLGTTKEQLADILKAAGADDDVVNTTLRSLAPSMEKAGESKHLRARIGWDMNRPYSMPDGSTFRILDGVNTNLEQVLKTYNNTISARVGLAKKGFTNTGQITERFNKILDQYQGDPLQYSKAKDFLANTQNLLLGRPVGDMESATLQVASTAARALHLKNSGIYNMIDVANSIREFGFTAIMKNFSKGFKSVLLKEDITPAQAQTITDIIKGRLINEGKMRSVYTHLDSSYQTTNSLFLQGVNTVGQSVKFLNGSEFVRRQHLGMIAGIQGELLEGLPKGNAKSVEYLKGIGMSDVRIAELKAAIDKDGLYDSLWPTDLADEVAARLTSSIDTLALQVRKGETPSFLAYSSVGRVLFPYFTFVAASHNKILRKEYERNGASGIAMHMLTAAPLAYIAASMVNLTSGKDPFEDINTKAMSILPTLGYFSMPVNFGMRGEFGGTPAPFAIINSIPKLVESAATGNLEGMVKNSPVLAVALPVRLVMGVLGGDGNAFEKVAKLSPAGALVRQAGEE